MDERFICVCVSQNFVAKLMAVTLHTTVSLRSNPNYAGCEAKSVVLNDYLRI